MYKSRLVIWGLIACLFITITSAMNLNVKSMLSESKAIKVKYETDSVLKSSFEKKIKGANLMTVSSGEDVIIKTASDEDIEGYTKMEASIFSPIVAFFPYAIKSNEITYQMGNSYYCNMTELADAVLSEKTIGELGLTTNENYMDSKVILCLPSEGTLYYDQVIDEIYISLNGNKIPTDEERAKLKETVDALLAKSETCNDIAGKIKAIKYGEYYVFIGPEFTMQNGGFALESRSWYYFPAYFEKSTALKYDLFVKSGDEETAAIVRDMLIDNCYVPDTTNYRTSYIHKYNQYFSCGSVVLKNVELAY